MKLYYFPWTQYDLYEDGSASINDICCIKKYYSVQEMSIMWDKWYVHIINPLKNEKLLKISLFDANIEHIPGIKIDDDNTCKLNTVDDFNNITVAEIFGLFFINIDINLENHKNNFIEALKIRCNLLNINGLDELFNGILKWTTAKYLLKHNKIKWTKYDTSLSYLNNKKPIFHKIDENDLIKIRLLGSVLYDKLNSYDKYLYLIINEKYPTKTELVDKYLLWMQTRKYPF